MDSGTILNHSGTLFLEAKVDVESRVSSLGTGEIVFAAARTAYSCQYH